MSKPKFTKSPWYISNYGTRQRMAILDRQLDHYDPRHTIATVCRAKGHEAANASLIAAAPEMYEMLTIIQDALRHGIHKSSIGVITEQGIDALLAMARGEGEAK